LFIVCITTDNIQKVRVIRVASEADVLNYILALLNFGILTDKTLISSVRRKVVHIPKTVNNIHENQMLPSKKISKKPKLKFRTF